MCSSRFEWAGGPDRGSSGSTKWTNPFFDARSTGRKPCESLTVRNAPRRTNSRTNSDGAFRRTASCKRVDQAPRSRNAKLTGRGFPAGLEKYPVQSPRSTPAASSLLRSVSSCFVPGTPFHSLPGRSNDSAMYSSNHPTATTRSIPEATARYDIPDDPPPRIPRHRRPARPRSGFQARSRDPPPATPPPPKPRSSRPPPAIPATPKATFSHSAMAASSSPTPNSPAAPAITPPPTSPPAPPQTSATPGPPTTSRSSKTKAA